MKKANVAIFVPNLGCPHACSFCDQREIAGQTAIPTPHDVEETARQALSQLGDSARDAEIAFFGGSFTAIEPALMRSLLEAAAPFTGEGGFHGIRISTRPDAIDAGILALLKHYGVTAIELGAQSMDDGVLAANHRGHTPHDVVTASELIHAYGFELGLQMMTGLYTSSPELDRQTARAIAALFPQTVRIYPTIIIEGTLLARYYREGSYLPQSLDDSVTLCAELLEFFEEKGIRVIRLGLHASESLENSYVAGPWHPAFRELCEGVIYRKKAQAVLKTLPGNCRNAALFVSPRGVSKLSGQHRKNILSLSEEFHVKIKICAKDLPEGVVEAAALQQNNFEN